jgi:hypothetical protein
MDFCKTFKIEPFLLSENDLCMAISHFSLQHTVNSVPSYVSAIQKLFNETASGPLPRSFAYYSTIRGLRRLLGPADEVVRTTAISLPELALIIRSLNLNDPDEVCFGAESLTAFFFGLRAEDVHSDGRLRMQDIYPESDGSVLVVFPPGKSVRLFRHVACARREDGLDLLDWLKLLYSFLPPGAKAPRRAVFVSFKKGRDGKQHFPPVTRQEWISKFKDKVFKVLNRSPALYAGHSFRRGLATDLIAAEVPLPLIKSHVGWAPSSNAIFAYHDHAARRQKLLPTSKLSSV